MRVNRGGTGGGSMDQGDGQGATRAPGTSSTQGDGAAGLPSPTDRGNQNDEGSGSSATRRGGGEANAPGKRGSADLDPTPDTANHFGTGGTSSDNPDVTGTTDELEN